MPPIIKVSDQDVCVATSEFPFAKWKFEKFNPVQSRIMEFYNQDCNALVAARTSAGKTVIAEQFLSQEIRERGGKGMFLAPLRALAREKVTDWTNPEYHLSDLKISICTGDYRLTKERTQELDDADIIIMTSEMLSHRSRSHNSEQSQFLKKIGTLVIDEFHTIGVHNRGDHLEVGLMKFTQINPTARLVLLSATMPNVEQLAEWVSYSLNQKQTFVLRSEYRPVPLTIHYETYDDSITRYDLVEQEKINLENQKKASEALALEKAKNLANKSLLNLNRESIQKLFYNNFIDIMIESNFSTRFPLTSFTEMVKDFGHRRLEFFSYSKEQKKAKSEVEINSNYEYNIFTIAQDKLAELNLSPIFEKQVFEKFKSVYDSLKNTKSYEQ